MEVFAKMMNLRIAHICDIWALLVFLGCIVVILFVSILQSKCIAESGVRRVIGDQLSVISDAEVMKLVNKEVSCG